MKKLMLFFIVLLLAVGLGVLIHNHPAYLFISMGHMSLQTSLWFALLALIIGIYLVHLIIGVVQGIYHIPSQLQHFVVERRQRTSSVYTKKALSALIEGDWKTCENYFYKSAKKQTNPFFHYMAAAQAAFEQKKLAVANNYLQKAQKIAKPSETLALEMMRVRWQLSSADYQQALNSLVLLQNVAPKHPFVLNGLREVYLNFKNWQKLQELLPKLRQYTALNPVLLDELERHVFSAALEQAGQTKSLAVLEQSWKAIPKKWRETPQLIAIYTKYLIENNQHEQAEAILKLALRKSRDAVLLQQYACVNGKDPVKQLARAESWLKQDPQNPDLLFCLGKLCARHRLWGKARTYLETSLKFKPRAEIYPVLGEVLEHLDQKYAALDCYKKGLEYSTTRHSAPVL